MQGELYSGAPNDLFGEVGERLKSRWRKSGVASPLQLALPWSFWIRPLGVYRQRRFYVLREVFPFLGVFLRIRVHWCDIYVEWWCGLWVRFYPELVFL